LSKSAETAEVAELAKAVEAHASALGEQAAKLPETAPLSVEDPKGNRTLERIDWLTRWGLAVVGLCLLIGLLSRTNAWLAALFLLMTPEDADEHAALALLPRPQQRLRLAVLDARGDHLDALHVARELP